jgi:hypothetical protein
MELQPRRISISTTQLREGREWAAGGGRSRNEVNARAILGAGPVRKRRPQETLERDRIGRLEGEPFTPVQR